MIGDGAPHAGSARFELSVVGGLGPVLEQALAPCRSHGARVLTVVRLPCSQVDLVDLFIRLAESDIEVEGISVSE